ncbi:hypothetical protein BVRB_2g045660 [Beta vulgaris subsp. vulgaris]|uniref:Uncharacterized protein n=1 Tax=Beta vulgaris subsp. vulgaris TaxID=3555 RepID=A0A0J8BGZ5_BETVV|nr:hypothetical protein BVRB_2g045660 [Beta vulgaris subsp. vulgaris]
MPSCSKVRLAVCVLRLASVSPRRKERGRCPPVTGDAVKVVV